MEGTEGAPRAALRSLPVELQSQIFKHEELTKDDIKNMRLMARELHKAANEILFRSIRISRLREDRDLFVQSCNDPNIAPYVKEVVWDEVGWDQTLFPELSKSMAGNIPPWPDKLTPVQRALWGVESERIFWFPVADPTLLFRPRTMDSDVADRRKLAVDVFGPTFQACIDKLTRLHTFTSRPINPERLWGRFLRRDSDRTIRRMGIYPGSPFYSWGEWIKGQICQLFDELDSTYSTKHQDGHPKLPRNDGLFMFLLPAMDRPTSTVRHLLGDSPYVLA